MEWYYLGFTAKQTPKSEKLKPASSVVRCLKCPEHGIPTGPTSTSVTREWPVGLRFRTLVSTESSMLRFLGEGIGIRVHRPSAPNPKP